MRQLYYLHDRLTTIGAALSAVSIAVICFSYCFEVVSRYFFNAPTSWVNAVTAYLLLACVMLMAPYVTRERSHVTIAFLVEFLGPERARYALLACIATSAAVCFLSVWFTGVETERQLVAGTKMTDSLLFTPKWVLSALIAYGFLSSGIYFLRQLFGDVAAMSSFHPNKSA